MSAAGGCDGADGAAAGAGTSRHQREGGAALGVRTRPPPAPAAGPRRRGAPAVQSPRRPWSAGRRSASSSRTGRPSIVRGSRASVGSTRRATCSRTSVIRPQGVVPRREDRPAGPGRRGRGRGRVGPAGPSPRGATGRPAGPGTGTAPSAGPRLRGGRTRGTVGSARRRDRASGDCPPSGATRSGNANDAAGRRRGEGGRGSAAGVRAVVDAPP